MGCQTEEVAVNAEAAQMRFRSLQWELENQLGTFHMLRFISRNIVQYMYDMTFLLFTLLFDVWNPVYCSWLML